MDIVRFVIILTSLLSFHIEGRWATHYLHNKKGTVIVLLATYVYMHKFYVCHYLPCLDVNYSFIQDKWSALLLAARHGRTKVVKILLNAGASMTVSNKV